MEFARYAAKSEEDGIRFARYLANNPFARYPAKFCQMGF
jgi:hypothetical protein